MIEMLRKIHERLRLLSLSLPNICIELSLSCCRRTSTGNRVTSSAHGMQSFFLCGFSETRPQCEHARDGSAG